MHWDLYSPVLLLIFIFRKITKNITNNLSEEHPIQIIILVLNLKRQKIREHT